MVRCAAWRCRSLFHVSVGSVLDLARHNYIVAAEGQCFLVDRSSNRAQRHFAYLELEGSWQVVTLQQGLETPASICG